MATVAQNQVCHCDDNGASMFKCCLQTRGVAFCPFKGLWSKDSILFSGTAGLVEPIRCLPDGNVHILPFVPLLPNAKELKFAVSFQIFSPKVELIMESKWWLSGSLLCSSLNFSIYFWSSYSDGKKWNHVFQKPHIHFQHSRAFGVDPDGLQVADTHE